MKVLCEHELVYVSGGNALDTVTGSFVSSSSGAYSGSFGSSFGGSYGESYGESRGEMPAGWVIPVASVSQCATAECAAGVLPAASENRTAAEIDASLCKTVVTLVATPVLAATNMALGLGLVGTLAGQGVKAGLKSLCD